MKMKMPIVILAGILALFFFSACTKVVGEGPVVTQARPVSGFKGVTVDISGKVYYKIDPVYKVEVQAQQNILDVIRTDVQGEDLQVRFKSNTVVKTHEPIVVTISAPVADFVYLNGSAEFSMTGALSGTNCNLKVSGSGSITIPQLALTDRLTASISGSGNIRVQGGTGLYQNLRISGSGEMDSPNFQSKETIADISGSGSMRVYATDKLDASISGSGSVYYRGTPVVSTHISGSGRVRPL